MKYLLATCGADQQRSKKNTDLGNFMKYVVLQPERLEQLLSQAMTRFYDAFYRKLQLHN